MTLRILAATALGVVVAALLPGPAAAIPSADDGDWADPEPEYDVAQSDLVIDCSSSASVLSASLTTASRDSTLTSTATSLASAAESDSSGDACAAGASRSSCRTVTVRITKRTAFYLSVAFRWVVEKEWCWAYPRVTWWRTRTYVETVDPFIVYRGIVSRFDDYFTWCCFSASSGHRSYRMARFENCLPIRGCIASWYPRVQINVHGNGTYSVPVKGV